MNDNNNANGAGNHNHEIPRYLLQHAPRPREVSFTLMERQQESMYIVWAAVRGRVRQQVYYPGLPFPPYPLPLVWPDDIRAMMVLWVARERRMFEMEMTKLEYILGLRARAH
ncbi:uncharacterized protein F5891DRAFT_1186504 [Suillus fuscotomentosus]|uniref:Uncharacterized protein n=1 Tax=Suillus fuscotomentosus TaxID=1912939 RepID=A0AAD4HN47_9AGAM|nr:uncharacterized protein F5891DRAFT_1186504 [Suillus fuscotomentosus]KAG1902396.1 hypothetical protein F5891DRAFT_1186504 [Suillus fuscotomentosus]